MGLNSIGFALNSTTDDIKDIMDKLNIVIEGPLETTTFENAISNFIEENDIFFTKLENGTLITTGINFPITEEGFSVLSANDKKVTKFIYGETSGEYYFEYFENGNLLRSKHCSDTMEILESGKALEIEFKGLKNDELVLELISKTCGNDFFYIEPNTKTEKYKFVKGKPELNIINAKKENTNYIKNRNDKAVSKNRLVFYLLLTHVFLGIANLVSANIFFNKPFLSQITSYISLLFFAVIIGYFLLLRKNWMRLIVIILFIFSIPLSIFVLRFNSLLVNNILQLLSDGFIVYLLFKKDLKNLYKSKTKVDNNQIFEKITIKETFLILIGVIIVQIGASDFIFLLDLIPMGFISGIISGLFMILGIYLIKRTLKNNYYR